MVNTLQIPSGMALAQHFPLIMINRRGCRTEGESDLPLGGIPHLAP